MSDTPHLPPSPSAMFVFTSAALSKANCFTAPPGAPQEDFPPFCNQKFQLQSLISIFLTIGLIHK